MDSQEMLLTLAERYVLDGEARATRLVAVISQRALNGSDTAEAEAALAQLQVMLKARMRT